MIASTMSGYLFANSIVLFSSFILDVDAVESSVSLAIHAPKNSFILIFLLSIISRTFSVDPLLPYILKADQCFDKILRSSVNCFSVGLMPPGLCPSLKGP